MALTTDGNARWCALDPRRGTALVVAEAALNVACAGARPVALVNCLNFGNPEHPEVMWQLSESIDGMADACRALSIPVVGGNVSLYNESRGRDIDPTPVVGMLGLIDRLGRPPPSLRLVDGAALLLLGATGRELGGSAWAWQLHGHRGGALPALDLDRHRALLELVRELVGAAQLVRGIHDVGDGGIAVALAEMAVRSGVGFDVAGVADHVALFSESPSRVVLCADPGDVARIRARSESVGVPVTELGRAGGEMLIVEGLVDLPLERATRAWRDKVREALDVA
jgi:phosphoribosylformylglycinamidine synthase